MTFLQKSAFGAALLTAVGASMFQAHRNSALRDQIQALHQEQQSLTQHVSQLEQEHSKYKQQRSALRNDPSPVSLDTPPKPRPHIPELPPLPSAGLEDTLDRACSEPHPGKREAAMQRISKSILATDIPRALAHMATSPGMSGVDSPLFNQLASKWGESDPEPAFAWANGLPDPAARRAALLNILSGWTHSSPETAATSAAKLQAGDLQDAAVLKVVKEWSFRDASDAAAWVSTFPDGKLRDKAAREIIFWGQGQCPAAVADMLDAIGNPDLTRQHGETLASIWLSRDAPAARAWIEQAPLPDDAKERLLSRADDEK